MARKKRRNVLGLDTQDEQDRALSMANRAYEQAADAFFAGDQNAYSYYLGYISGIHDLAVDEGATVLSGLLQAAITRLRQISR